MNSGLYALAGDSATATAAAWANRLDEPMTNVSNMYFGFSRLPVSPGLPRSSRCWATWPPGRLPLSGRCRPGPLSGPLDGSGTWASSALGSRVAGTYGFGLGLGTGTTATATVGSVNGVAVAVRGLDRHRHLDRAAEVPGQRLGDRGPQLRLDHVAGERVRHGQQRGVVEDRAENGETQVRPLLRRPDLVAEILGSGVPHRGVVHRFCCHRSRPTPVACTAPERLMPPSRRHRGPHGGPHRPQVVHTCASAVRRWLRHRRSVFVVVLTVANE